MMNKNLWLGVWAVFCLLWSFTIAQYHQWGGVGLGITGAIIIVLLCFKADRYDRKDFV